MQVFFAEEAEIAVARRHLVRVGCGPDHHLEDSLPDLTAAGSRQELRVQDLGHFLRPAGSLEKVAHQFFKPRNLDWLGENFAKSVRYFLVGHVILTDAAC